MACINVKTYAGPLPDIAVTGIHNIFHQGLLLFQEIQRVREQFVTLRLLLNWKR
jgi:hypothetical protein